MVTGPGDRAVLDQYPYKNIVGMLNYLKTRPDVLWITRELQRHLENYGCAMIMALERVLKYLQATKTKGMLLRADYPRNLPTLLTMSDASFADCQRTRGTLYGIIVFVYDVPLQCRPKFSRQSRCRQRRQSSWQRLKATS